MPANAPAPPSRSLKARLDAWDVADGKPFVALMLANNETGVIQPVAEVAVLVRQAEGWLHVDAIQAAGKIAIDSRALGAFILIDESTNDTVGAGMIG